MSASADSAIPVVRNVHDITTLSLAAVFPSPRIRANNLGISSSDSIERISRGTPGNIATHRPRLSSIKIPGALPCGFGIIVAPSGIIA